MQITSVRRCEVTNPWSTHRVLEARLSDIPPDLPSASQLMELHSAVGRLELPPHLASCVDRETDLAIHLPPRDRTWPQVIARLAAILLHAVGQPQELTAFVEIRDSEPSILLECLEFELALVAAQSAAALASDVCRGASCDVASVFARVRSADEDFSFGDATGPIVAAARQRDVPVIRLDSESRVQLGHGVHSRRIRKAATDATGFLAEQSSTDKQYTKRLWSRLGIPVPAGRIAIDADDAVVAATELGWPVVVKPLDADYSNGVTLNISDGKSVRAAYDVARQESETVIVERFLTGALHRFLIVGNRVVSAVRRDPPSVTGDGVHTIRELMEIENASSRRGPDERWPLQRMQLSSAELLYLNQQQLAADSIPQAGVRIDLRREPFLTCGGETHEVLDRVHVDTLEMVLDAVRVVGLDIAGVDMIARDISVPLNSQDGGLLELNAQPAICLHLAPFNDKPRPVGEAIIRTLFNDSETGRIPLAVVISDISAPTGIEPILRQMERRHGATAYSTPLVSGLRNRRLMPASNAPADRLSALFLHPQTEAACLAVPLESVLESGLGTDRCQLLVLDRCDGGRTSRTSALVRRMMTSADLCLINMDETGWRSLDLPMNANVVTFSSDRRHDVCEQDSGRTIECDGSSFILRSGGLVIDRWHIRPADLAVCRPMILAAAMLMEGRLLATAQ
jgi:cyanophycin synthetase